MTIKILLLLLKEIATIYADACIVNHLNVYYKINYMFYKKVISLELLFENFLKNINS